MGKTIGKHVTVWFGERDIDLLAMLKQPGVNTSGMIKLALRAYVEDSKPSVIAKAVVDELSSRGLFLSLGEQCDEDELEGLLGGAVRQFANQGGEVDGG